MSHCKKNGSPQNEDENINTTSNNHVTISRRQRRCKTCGQYSFPVERMLGLDNDYSRGVSILGDGAKWIWNLSEHLFSNTAECLDIFHTAAHISGCGKVLFKDEAKQRCWFEDTRLLLRKGFAGVNEELQRLLKSDLFDADQQDEVRLLLSGLSV